MVRQEETDIYTSIITILLERDNHIYSTCGVERSGIEKLLFFIIFFLEVSRRL